MMILFYVGLVAVVLLLAFAWYGKRSLQKKKTEWKQQQDKAIEYLNNLKEETKR